MNYTEDNVEFYYTDEQKDLFYRLQSKKGINFIKNITIIILLILIILTVKFKAKYNSDYFKVNEVVNITNLSLAYIIHYFIICSTKLWLYDQISYERNKEKLYEKINIKSVFSLKEKGRVYKFVVIIKKFFLHMFSPDLLYSIIFKDLLKREATEIEFTKEYFHKKPTYYSIWRGKEVNVYQWSQTRIERKFFIEWSNWINVIISCFSCFLIYLLCLYSKSIANVCYMFLIVRVISRGVEIAVAFYKDVVAIDSVLFHLHKTVREIYIQNFKSSIIRNRTRLSLAIHSLIELIILFSAIYYMTGMFVGIKDKYEFTTPIFALLHSASLGVFNYSFDIEYKGEIFLAFIHVWQLLLSGVLLLLSIALYIGREDSIKDELSLYKYVYKKLHYIDKGNK